MPALTLLTLLSSTTALAEEGALSERAEQMARRQLALWTDPAQREGELSRLRDRNPEWDFMGRTFLVLALSSIALEQPSREAELLPVIDDIIADTLRYEEANGQRGYLMGYAADGRWINPTGRSLFIDGEVAMMVGARRLVEDDGRWDQEHTARIEAATANIAASPALMGESYPDEGWMFCNTLALAAVTIYDHLEEKADHSDLIARWLASTRASHLDAETGMLLSSMSWQGRPKDGPEGSSLWLSAHMLQFIDPAFAEEQYRLGRRALGRTLMGMGYAREWPEDREDTFDVDAGEIVPVLGASTSSSGLAIVAARSFADRRWHAALLRSLDVAAQPVEDPGGGLRYARSNAVGDAVILYGLVEGPLREALRAP